MKREKRFGIWVAALLLAVLGSPAFADSDSDSDSDSDGGSLAGTWQLTTTIDGQATTSLFTFNDDGNVIGTAPLAAFGTAHGVWEKTGNNSFSSTHLAFIFDDSGVASLILKANGDYELTSNNTFTLDFVQEISLPDGTPVDTLAGSGTGTRIVLEDP